MSDVMNRSGHGRAHGKLILIGEHAVVYGFPAIALPMPSVKVAVRITTTPGEDWLNSAYYRGPLAGLPRELDGVRIIVDSSREMLNWPSQAMTMDVHSTIPAEYGLGSSAAVAVALTRAIYDFHAKPLSNGDLFKIVHAAETSAHGMPSGVDTWATSSDQPIWFIRGGSPEPLYLIQPLFLVVARSNAPGSTRDTIRQIRESQTSHDPGVGPMERLGVLARAARLSLERGNYEQLGSLMTEAHRELQRLQVTTAHLDQLVTTALQYGALGAKLTGGGAGGSMIALAGDELQQARLSRVLMAVGARQVWTPTMEGQ